MIHKVGSWTNPAYKPQRQIAGPNTVLVHCKRQEMRSETITAILRRATTVQVKSTVHDLIDKAF